MWSIFISTTSVHETRFFKAELLYYALVHGNGLIDQPQRINLAQPKIFIFYLNDSYTTHKTHPSVQLNTKDIAVKI